MVAVQSATRPGNGPSEPAQDTPDVRLSDMRPGTSGHVVDIDESAEPSTARRLFDLGFAPGAEIAVLRKAPLGDPVVFQLMDYEVALRKAQASAIRIRRGA